MGPSPSRPGDHRVGREVIARVRYLFVPGQTLSNGRQRACAGRSFVTELWQTRSLRDAGPTHKRGQPIGQRSGAGENPPATMRTGAPLPSAGTDHTSVAAPAPVGSP
jgi:hypothetical protein